MRASARVWQTGGLVFFQLLGLAIPLVILPILAHHLGVVGFGQVMLAQSVVLLAALWVDAGFNTESQRRASARNSTDTRQTAQQALLDNLLARSLCAVIATGVLLVMPLVIPSLSYTLLFVSLPVLLGTLLFPQWWLVAIGRGTLMGISTTLGRAMSAVLVWLYVDGMDDLVLAAFIVSLGSVFSGLLVLPVWLSSILKQRTNLDWHHWRSYLQAVRPNVFSAFLAQAASQLPLIALGSLPAGTIQTTLQTGLFSAADRLTRAAAHVLSFIEQSLMSLWLVPLQGNATSTSELTRTRRLLLVGIAVTLVCAASLGTWLAPWIVQWLYGEQFLGSVVVLQSLLVWLCLHGVRRALVLIYLAAHGHITAQARLQWWEVLLSLTAVSVVWLLNAQALPWLPGSMGAAHQMATALCMVETLLLLLSLRELKRSP